MTSLSSSYLMHHSWVKNSSYHNWCRYPDYKAIIIYGYWIWAPNCKNDNHKFSSLVRYKFGALHSVLGRWPNQGTVLITVVMYSFWNYVLIMFKCQNKVWSFFILKGINKFGIENFFQIFQISYKKVLTGGTVGATWYKIAIQPTHSLVFFCRILNAAKLPAVLAEWSNLPCFKFK